MNKVPAVIVNIQRQPGANIIDVVDRIKALLPKLRATIPAAIKITVARRPHDDRARLGGRRRVRAAAVHRAGRGGHLRVPAHLGRDPHPRHRGAAVPGRHLRRDVRARLQPQQSHAHGAHDLDRLRRRRRDRDDREHHALRRTGGEAAGGGAEGRRTDRLHDHVPDRFADRGADPAAFHGRHHRPALPRVRRHAERDDPDLGVRVADPDADALLAAAASHARPRSKADSTAGRSAYSRSSSAFTRARWIGCSRAEH